MFSVDQETQSNNRTFSTIILYSVQQYSVLSRLTAPDELHSLPTDGCRWFTLRETQRGEGGEGGEGRGREEEVSG